jgi:FKBP-type peptidyl-prolyl cis-trans isomerases 1
MRNIPGICLTLILISACFSSCKESEEFDDHHNWKERNIAYINDLAAKCDNNLTETNANLNSIFRIASYRLDPKAEKEVTDFIYCQIISKGDGKESPLYTDSIRINYRLRLIPTDNYPNGQVLDQSYTTPDLEPEFNIPSSFVTSGLVDGVVTALQHMHTGDRWRICIPYTLGYGDSDVNKVPGYSTLIFDINLVEFARTGKKLSPK